MEGGGRREEEEGPRWSFRVVGFDCRAIWRHLEVIWRHLESSGGIWSHLEASGGSLETGVALRCPWGNLGLGGAFCIVNYSV